MRDFAKISCSIWGSKKFSSLKSSDARLVYFYLHTCQHVNSLGCFVLRTGYALADLGWDDSDDGPIAYRKAISALCEAGLIEFNKAESVVRIVDFLRHSPFTNIKHAKGAIKILYQIPYCPEKDRLINDLRGMKHITDDLLPEATDSLSTGFRYTETRDQRPETETYIGGGDGRAPAQVEILPPPGQADPDAGNLTLRERMLDAMGADRSGVVNAKPTSLGGRVDMIEAGRWQTDLGLTDNTIIAVIADAMSRKSDGPPTTFRYFTAAMQREAARQTQAPLKPASINEAHHDQHPARNHREAAETDRTRRIIDAAAGAFRTP